MLVELIWLLYDALLAAVQTREKSVLAAFDIKDNKLRKGTCNNSHDLSI